jgi:lactoylglutathione lyase
MFYNIRSGIHAMRGKLMYLSYFGIRVTDLERSLKFYSELFGLEEVARGDRKNYGAGVYVLLRDPKSHMKLELNWYPERSRYAVPYVPGEGLDHLAFKVDDVPKTYAMLINKGAGATEIDPSVYGGWSAYVKDPDGNWIEIYQQGPPTDSPIPEGY